MKTKIGTVLDAGPLRQARLVAAREGKRLSQVLEEALAHHLKRKSAGTRGGVATRTAGSLKLIGTRSIESCVRRPGILDG
jgi:hypothetical protein